jgi:hypothetical protein
MSRSTRIRQILEQPAYRTKLAFFVLLSITTFLAALRLPPNSLARDTLLEFAVTFGAVGVLQLLWDFLGGEPSEVQIENIQQSITLMSDLINANIGIERIWPDRHTWEEDSDDGREKWYTRVCQARHIDMVSNTLWDNWIKREEFREEFFKHIDQDAPVARILIYDPDSEAFDIRAKDEGHRSEMQQEIAKTLGEVTKSVGTNLDVLRLTTEIPHPAQIIRADERMLVAIYLSGKAGSPSPTMQLRGSDSIYFRKYEDQFITFWERTEPLSDDRVIQILQKYGDRSNLPAKD